MAYRIVRSPERRVFKIDVGNIPPQDVEQYMQKVMTQMKRNQILDVNTGRVDLRYNPLSIEEDYYIPVRGQASGTEISTIGGGQYTGDIDDVKYLRDKLFSALKVPMSYLSRGDGADEDKATLAQKDIRFARTIQRLQRSVVSELEKIVTIHLFTLGYRGNDLLSFKLALNNPSKLAELQELEHWKARFEAADGATEGFFSRRWVANNILNVSEEEFLRMQEEMYYDRKHDFALEQVGEATAAAAGGAAGGLGGLGGESGGVEGLESESPGADEPEEDAGDEGPLLATPAGDEPEATPGASPPEGAPGGEEGAPGKRDDSGKVTIKDKFGRTFTATANSKGKMYESPPYDKRKGSGPRSRANKGSYSKFLASSSDTRSFLPGKNDLDSLYRFSENLDPNYYDEQEDKIFRENVETKKLIESLQEKSTDEVQS